MSYRIGNNFHSLLQGLSQRTFEMMGKEVESTYQTRQMPGEQITFERTLVREFSEMLTRALEVLSKHGHKESTNPYGISQVKKLIADQQMLFLGHLPTISWYTKQVWRLLEGSIDVIHGVNLWELPKVSNEIVMLATSCNVINKLLSTNHISISSLTEIDREIEMNLQRLNNIITNGLHGSSFQMDRIYPILFSLCENYGSRAMTCVAQATGLDHLKTRLQSHKLAPTAPLGAFSTAYVAYIGDKSCTPACFSDSLRALLNYYGPYNKFYTTAQRTSASEVTI